MAPQTVDHDSGVGRESFIGDYGGKPVSNARPFLSALALISIAVWSPFLAAHEQGHREHGVHQHGVGELNVAVEGSAVHVELITPAANIVGFEHAPRDAEEEAALRTAIDTLRAGDALFALSPQAGCEWVETDVQQHHDDELHSEFHLTYQFSCRNPSALKHIDVNLFSLFPATERLITQVISPSSQSALQLTPTAKRIEL